MKSIITLFFSCIVCLSYAQENTRISTMDFVQILDEQHAETIYYYENNWRELRIEALKLNYIDSYQLLEVPREDDLEFDIILITTYANQEQFDKREDNFAKLIEARGGRDLLNDKQPNEFRKIILSRGEVSHTF